MRSFVIEDEDIDADDEIGKMKLEIKKEMINKLASEWNSLNNQIESRRYQTMNDDYADAFTDVHEDQVEDEAHAVYEKAIKEGKSKAEARQLKDEARERIWEELEEEHAKVDRKPYIRMEVIEELLARLGARMMRPYEHWNEDERYMEYMENRYSYDEY